MTDLAYCAPRRYHRLFHRVSVDGGAPPLLPLCHRRSPSKRRRRLRLWFWLQYCSFDCGTNVQLPHRELTLATKKRTTWRVSIHIVKVTLDHRYFLPSCHPTLLPFISSLLMAHYFASHITWSGSLLASKVCTVEVTVKAGPPFLRGTL